VCATKISATPPQSKTIQASIARGGSDKLVPGIEPTSKKSSSESQTPNCPMMISNERTVETIIIALRMEHTFIINNFV
jgi:hypothetical protein